MPPVLGAVIAGGAAIYGANKQAKSAKQAAAAQTEAADKSAEIAQQRAADQYNFFAPRANAGARFAALQATAAGGRPTRVSTYLMPTTYGEFQSRSQGQTQAPTPYLTQPQGASQRGYLPPRAQSVPSSRPAPAPGEVRQMRDGAMAQWNAITNRFERLG